MPETDPFELFDPSDADFTAVIASDLHFSTTDIPVLSASFPLQKKIESIVRTLFAQVLDLHPDVFILCGDNTNIGDTDSMERLSELLSVFEKAGIPVVMCPGNHDYSSVTKKDYARCFSYIVELTEEQLCYSESVRDYCIIAMDDNYEGNGVFGRYTDAELAWLESQLGETQAAGRFPILVTHHNLFRGGVPMHEENYVLQNDGLADLLAKYQVKLVLSGHRHSQEIIYDKERGIYEIISGFPASYPFYFGILQMRGNELRYKAQPIGFAAYGEPYGAEHIPDEYEESRNRTADFSAVMDSILDNQTLSRRDRAGIRELFVRFIREYSCGTLADSKEEIQNDPYYHKMLLALKGTNYDVWILYAMEHIELPGNRLSVIV